MRKNFPDWLNDVLIENGWSQSELARRAGVSRATISDVISGQENPGYKLCVGVADALHLPAEEVLKIAGLLKVQPEDDPKVSEIKHIYHTLDKARQEELVEYARWQLQLQEGKSKGDGKHSSSRRNRPASQ